MCSLLVTADSYRISLMLGRDIMHSFIIFLFQKQKMDICNMLKDVIISNYRQQQEDTNFYFTSISILGGAKRIVFLNL